MARKGVHRYAKGAITEHLRDYFIDETWPLPTLFNVDHRVFLYKGQVLVRDCAFVDLKVNNLLLFGLPNFSQLHLWSQSTNLQATLLLFRNLALWREYKIDDIVDVDVPLHSNIHQYWPRHLLRRQ